MSSPHATISAWTRSHEGPYEAELYDWKLVVQWTPNTSESRGSFSWVATQGDREEHAEHSFEEMELAMADAEHFAQEEAARRTAELAALNA
jgi:hypothetical protein